MMKHWVVAFIFLNLADALSTVAAVGTGTGRELNPVMASLISLDPIAFAAVKIGVCGIGLLYLEEEHLGLRIAFKALTLALAALMLWHVLNWIGILFGA